MAYMDYGTTTTLTLRDGRTETLFDEVSDFGNIIYQELGIEAERVYKDIVEGKVEEIEYDHMEKFENLWDEVNGLIEDVENGIINIQTGEMFTASKPVMDKLKEILEYIEKNGGLL